MAKHPFDVRFAFVILLCFGGLFGFLSASTPAVAAEAAPPAAKKAATHDEPKAAAHPVAEVGAAPEHPVAPHGAANHGGGHAKNPYDPIEWKKDLALWSLITFIIFAVILKLAAWGPLTTALDAREAKIHGNLAHAELAREKAERLLVDYQTQLAAAQDQILKMMADARRDAEHTRQEILAQTEKDVSLLKDRAVAEIERTRDFALNELFGHMAGTVANATEKVLGRALTDSDQDRLVNEALAEFSRQQAS